MEELVVIKSTGGVIELWLESSAKYADLKEALLLKLNMYKSFYAGTTQKVMFYGKQLTDEQKREMRLTLFSSFDIKNVHFVDEELSSAPAKAPFREIPQQRPLAVLSPDPPPDDAPATPEPSERDKRLEAAYKPIAPKPVRPIPAALQRTAQPEPQPPVSAASTIIPSTVRSGQRIVSDGDIVVIGDVNSGAELIAGGSIVVFGKLRGVAHAGCGGRTDVLIATNGLRASQIRICGKIALIPPEHPGNVPEVAEIIDDKIVVREIG